MNRTAHAVVMGASYAGLLTAKVLAKYFDKVTLVERDELFSRLAQSGTSTPRSRMHSRIHVLATS